MSFKLFIYYCAVCAAWGAFGGWLLGWGLTPTVEDPNTQLLLGDLFLGFCLGLLVALALGIVDAVMTLSGAQPTQVFVRGLFVAAVGAVAGLLGAGIGHYLVKWTEKDLFMILGWTLTGLLIGASVGLYDFIQRMRAGDRSGGGKRKLLNGFMGGTLGGLLGGLLFWLAGLVLGKLFGKSPDELRSTGAMGFVAIGACIGLFIGLAQVFLKEAWLKVESGRRAGRELILSKDETTIGRAESCDLGLFGDNAIEKLHARILLKNNRYLLADEDTPGGTYLNEQRIGKPTPLNSGDTIRVGSCVLRFSERQKKSR
jgi:hypothetical protein